MHKISLALALAACPALAEVPHVVTDIAPVQGLAALVMDGVGTPAVILPPGASPHGYAMRPSEARALAKADVVVWVGPALTPWLHDPLDSLAPAAQRVELMQVEGVRLLPFRSGEMFGGHDDHDHGHGHDDDGHDEDGLGADPHIWLDPQNAIAILSKLADTLGQIDPDNAGRYDANAQAATREIAQLQDEITQQLMPVHGTPVVVTHDAYHYFEARFDVEAEGAISLADGAAAQPGHLADLRAAIATSGARCVLVEPGARSGLVDAVFETAEVTVGSIDALGSEHAMGPDFYPMLLKHTAQAFAGCLDK